MPPTSLQIRQWTARELKRHLDRDEPIFILDTRKQEEFRAWRIEGRRPHPVVNVPAAEILQQGGSPDLERSVVDFVRRGGDRLLPRDGPIVTVCARGRTSVEVAAGLRRMDYDVVSLEGGMQAWGELYETVRVPAAGEEVVLQISRPARGCLSYIVASDGCAIVVDPLRHVQPYLDAARTNRWRVTAVIDTHAHADHVSGGRALAECVGAPYFLHPYDAIHPIDLLPGRLEFDFLRDRQQFPLGNVTLEILHVPGHTLGAVACVVGDAFVLTGDSIFITSVARPDLGGRSDEWTPLLHDSVTRLLSLPGGLRVLPGHTSSPAEIGPDNVVAANVADLADRNEGLRASRAGRAAFARYIAANLPRFPPEYLEMKRVNVGLAWADGLRQSELELGRNLCAVGQART